jgi:hypothetical protein
MELKTSRWGKPGAEPGQDRVREARASLGLPVTAAVTSAARVATGVCAVCLESPVLLQQARCGAGACIKPVADRNDCH